MLDIGRGVMAIVAGYATMIVLVVVADRLLVAYFPGTVEGEPSQTYVIGNLVWGFVAALVGGWATARIAPRRPLLHTAILAAVLVGVGILLLTSEPEAGQPAWYPAAIVVIGSAGALAGGLLGAMQRERVRV